MAASLTVEYALVHQSLLRLKTRLDAAMSHASPAQCANEQHVLGLIRTICFEADATENSLAGHSCRVSRLTRRISEQVGLSAVDIERSAAAGLFHDIGKLRIDGGIWTKPAVLDAAEFELVKMHPIYGAEMMRSYPALNAIIPGIELHHEALDGSGYPYRLKEDRIPMTARVTAVADAFDAMTSTREYQAAIPPDAALNTLRSLAGVKFDAAAVEALCDVMQGLADDGAPALVYESLIARTV